ncbi:uncharacterized protein LOC124265724 isoform X12 [Haliotis rubra]|uniref:uncharacterized protein LOC124265724 isoform X12 n=1 Tax=Haliotis rubra TaxID=36100 RepID=UPI001EE631E0|nr:uncharacterized protein LOC124265724 isoform X12 [Haliotis rubra]
MSPIFATFFSQFVQVRHIFIWRKRILGTTYLSKACYGSDPSCTQHHVSCNSTQKIAIVDYYTNNPKCTQVGLSSCDNYSADGVTEHEYDRFNYTEMFSLYKKCSTKSQCVFPGPRRNVTRTFSVVKYQCIEGDSLNISEGVVELSQAAINHGNQLMPNCSKRNDTYVCSFKSDDTATRIYALDVRLNRGNRRKCLSQLSVRHGNVITTNNCSTVFKPFERLNVTTELPLHIRFKDIRKQSSIWLLIKGTNTRTTYSHDSTTNDSIPSGQAESNAGAIAGGVVATVAVVLVVTLVSVWIIRHRRAKSEGKEKTASLPKDAKSGMTYSLAGKISQENYHEIQDLKTHNSDYDYATADDMGLPPTTNTYFTIEPAGKLTANDNSTPSAAEGVYDHIGDKTSQQTSDYDTTASVAQPGNTGEDGYGYNHFQKKANTQTQQNDYDTAASANQAVAQLSLAEKNTDEDDYDHCHRGTNASETVSSPYDSTSGVEDNPDYSVAGQMK